MSQTEHPHNRKGHRSPSRRKRNTYTPRQKAIAEALKATVRDLFEEAYGAPSPHQMPLELELRFQVAADGDWSLQFHPDIPTQLRPQLASAEAARGIYQDGHVYCFECGSSLCDHSTPQASREVFDGYSQTGRPVWRDFGQILLARKDEQVEQLYQERPRLCTLILDTAQLRARQLSIFGRDSKTYAILGQLSAGYFFLEDWDPRIHEDDRFALSWQVVESRNAGGTPELHLNSLGAIPGRPTLDELRADARFQWIHRAVAQARNQLSRGRTQNRHSGQVPSNHACPTSCLKSLASTLHQGQRQQERRTRHAQERRAVQRPVHKAMDDVVHAPAERFFMDLKHHSVVVLGPRSRCHIFAHNGKHITSFTIAQDAVRMRMRKKRWQELDTHQRKDFLARFHAHEEKPTHF